ncbi:AAA family ATPase [Kiloniella sp.]|uniref:AAA family ATPase n=1 Tax=Kiloniella sp. TaxID=1938587 RepID=UPI003A918136
MKIAFVEIQNFRKLKSVRIDFSEQKTIFVGANNSGKTTAMDALGHFLINHKRFSTNDLTLSNWEKINKIGESWEKALESGEEFSPSKKEWKEEIPILDLWLAVEKNEIHHVSHLLPSLDWEEGKLGVRLRYEPADIEELYSEYIKARKHAEETLQAAKEAHKEEDYTLSLWPGSMIDYLKKRMHSHFTINAYTLDPEKLTSPDNSTGAQLQNLPEETEPIDQPPFDRLLKIHEINAQRGFSDAQGSSHYDDSSNTKDNVGRYKLSEQLRGYYASHLDPLEFPEPHDVKVLQATANAQALFDKQLRQDFKVPVEELEKLGYPGVANPKVVIATELRPIEGLNHPAALQYEIETLGSGEGTSSPLRLPEQYNGLGYQNLISMVFRLMAFRDNWMRVGKAEKKVHEDNIAPLHLVIIEEPEAHLHVQVQQVFIRVAHDILRNHPDLKDNKKLTTQLVVSTHSSHIAHECSFEALRYFRRFPATNKGAVPTTNVINLSQVFGKEDKTERFVMRYLKTTHSDLFFADAAILVEGPAERMLVPFFIEKFYPKLSQSYITLLEIGGSYAHTLRPLIEHLGLTSLIVTDLDSINKDTKKSEPPKRAAQQITDNTTLKGWLPKKEAIDDLLDLKITDKEIRDETAFYTLRSAYQSPVKVSINGKEEEALPYTFEDSLVLENINIFKGLEGTGLIKKFKTHIETHKDVVQLSNALFLELKGTSDKAKFALDLLYELPDNFNVPSYIQEGLEWLQKELAERPSEALAASKESAA